MLKKIIVLSCAIAFHIAQSASWIETHLPTDSRIRNAYIKEQMRLSSNHEYKKNKAFLESIGDECPKTALQQFDCVLQTYKHRLNTESVSAAEVCDKIFGNIKKLLPDIVPAHQSQETRLIMLHIRKHEFYKQTQKPCGYIRETTWTPEWKEIIIPELPTRQTIASSSDSILTRSTSLWKSTDSTKSN